MSSSKDGLVKVWDLDTQHCCQTLAGHKAEVWSLDANAAGTRVACGSTDNEIRLYAVRCGAPGEGGGGPGRGGRQRVGGGG